MGHGGPRRRSLSWWKSHGRRASMNPNRIRVMGGRLSRRDIERYKANPKAGSDGGTPVCVVKLDGFFGGYFAREGRHRILAARATGRRVSVMWVHEREEQGR